VDLVKDAVRGQGDRGPLSDHQRRAAERPGAALKDAGFEARQREPRFAQKTEVQGITGHDRLPDVMEGIKEAGRVGLAPIKVNVWSCGA